MTHQKEARSSTSSLQPEHHQVSIPSHVYTTDVFNTPQASLSPEWIHAITTILQDHPLTSDPGKCIQKWIICQTILSYTKFALRWDPIQFEDNKHLQKYEERDGYISYLKSNTVKQLVSLRIYMTLLISQDRPADQKCNLFHFILS